MVQKETPKKAKGIPTVSVLLPNDEMAEMIYRPENGSTAFLQTQGSDVEERTSITRDGRHLIPYSATNNLITHGVVLFPSAVSPYASEQKLFDDVRDFIHRYVDLSSDFEAL